MKSYLLVAAFALSGSGVPAFAQNTTDHSAHHPAQGAQAGATLTPAEVRKVDKEAGKITLRHEAIPALDMPQMTMVFRVSDPKFLDRVKAGDKVLIAVEKVGGQFTVTRIEPAP
jgi:Cu(I)/Ag(I) efflux system protein CusF